MLCCCRDPLGQLLGRYLKSTQLHPATHLHPSHLAHNARCARAICFFAHDDAERRPPSFPSLNAEQLEALFAARESLTAESDAYLEEQLRACVLGELPLLPFAASAAATSTAGAGISPTAAHLVTPDSTPSAPAVRQPAAPYPACLAANASGELVEVPPTAYVEALGHQLQQQQALLQEQAAAMALAGMPAHGAAALCASIPPLLPRAAQGGRGGRGSGRAASKGSAGELLRHAQALLSLHSHPLLSAGALGGTGIPHRGMPYLPTGAAVAAHVASQAAALAAMQVPRPLLPHRWQRLPPF